jgi:diadenosine tetraphosphate (Ap4A) HIT family hydrolase
MPTKTYALFDVIGVKKAFAAGKTAEVLQAFWVAADAWTNGVASGLGPMPVLGGEAVQVPDAFVTTYSDSALLSTEPEFEIGAFWRLVENFKAKIDQATGASYVIVTRDDEVPHHELPALGFHVIGSGDTKHRYHNAGGSGPAFVHLFLAEQQIRTQVQQNGWKFSLYAVGPAAVPPGAKPAASVQFAGLGGRPQELHALR